MTERKLGDADALKIVNAAFEKYDDGDPRVVAFMAGAQFGFKLATEPRDGVKSDG